MTVLLVLAVLLAVFLLAGLVLMQKLCGRVSLPDFSDPQALAQAGYARNHPGVPEAQAWLRTRDVRDLTVVSYDNKRLHARLIPCENAKGTLLLFHGWHSAADLDFAPTMQWLHSLGYHLVLADQRAHGKSEGRFLTFGLKERMDVFSWVVYLSMLFGEDHPIYLGGVSMGAATVCMASDLEFPANVRGIVADCGYTSPYAIARTVIRQHLGRLDGLLTALAGFFTHLYAGFGLRDWSSEEALAQTKLPVLLLHGEADTFVPCHMSRTLQECCPTADLLTFPGADHCMSEPTDPVRYRRAVEDFLQKHLEEEREPQ